MSEDELNRQRAMNEDKLQTMRKAAVKHQENAKWLNDRLVEAKKRIQELTSDVAQQEYALSNVNKKCSEVEKREELLMDVLIWIRNRAKDESPHGPAHVVQMLLEDVIAVLDKTQKDRKAK